MSVPSQGHFTVFRLLTDFVCLYNYEFLLSLCKIVRSSVILLLPLFILKLFFQWMDGWFSLGPPVSFAHHTPPLKRYKQTNETKMNGGYDVTGMRSYMSFNTINHKHI